MKHSDLIYGKDHTTNVVAVEIDGDVATLFLEDENGITCKCMDHEFWLVLTKQTGRVFPLQGDNPFRFAKKFLSSKELYDECRNLDRSRVEYYKLNRPDEQFMVKQGVTLFKGVRHDQVSILSFDIETTGLVHDETSEVLLISNTFRNARGEVSRKLFSIDEYETDADMIAAWAKWVQIKDPSIMTGHNIFGFDLPYLAFCAGQPLRLGRSNKPIRFNKHTSQFRKDGSQSYDYKDCHIFGRQVIDTFFLSIKYDVARKFPSYGLKAIISYLGLEKEGRQHYDAGKIKENRHNPEEWRKIKQYAIEDADDSIALYDLMAPSYFYFCRSIPMSFQQIINRASGSQLNKFMLRAYIQEGRSIPRPSERVDYEGAISFGNPGIYDHVSKMDVASLYPSIIRSYKLYNKRKDPRAYFLQAIEFFTEERLANKKLANETGDKYYRDLEQSQKIIINSGYGFLGASGLHFNSPEHAAEITRRGREILTVGMDWVQKKGFQLVNVDTDSFSYTTGSETSQELLEEHIAEVNTLMPPGIVWEADGRFKRFIVVKAKNYAMADYGGKVTVKGSGLKATMKEPALKKFLEDSLTTLLEGNDTSKVGKLYSDLAVKCLNIRDISDWCSKKTVTKSVLNPARTNEQRILDAIGDKPVSEGDKIYVFFREKTELCLRENFDGTYHVDTLLEKLYKTAKILENILDTGLFPNFKLKRNKKLLEELHGQVTKLDDNCDGNVGNQLSLAWREHPISIA